MRVFFCSLKRVDGCKVEWGRTHDRVGRPLPYEPSECHVCLKEDDGINDLGGAGLVSVAMSSVTASRDMSPPTTRAEWRQMNLRELTRRERRAVRTSLEAFSRASVRRDRVKARRVREKKTFASDGVWVISGWVLPRPSGAAPYDVQDVLTLQRQIGHAIKDLGMRDHGVVGSQRASHAERQVALLSPRQPIGVTKPMCSDCQEYFRRLAVH